MKLETKQQRADRLDRFRRRYPPAYPTVRWDELMAPGPVSPYLQQLRNIYGFSQVVGTTGLRPWVGGAVFGGPEAANAQRNQSRMITEFMNALGGRNTFGL